MRILPALLLAISPALAHAAAPPVPPPPTLQASSWILVAQRTGEMLAGLDAIVIDLQDIGTRFYTYMTTMAYVMEEAATRKIKVVVLDRPNPIGGVQIEGPSLDQTAVGLRSVRLVGVSIGGLVQDGEPYQLELDLTDT